MELGLSQHQVVNQGLTSSRVGQSTQAFEVKP
uniref:Uncharacterized protein n=1 Tax=Arundo donax TaxID=35708 RepID=A0A0A8ZC83_ARUDO